MAFRLKVKFTGTEELLAAMRELQPTTESTWLGPTMVEAADLTIATARRRFMSGPRSSTRIDKISGDLQRSLFVDRSRLPQAATFGSSGVVYAPIHEFANQGARSYLQRAIDQTLKRDLPALFLKRWRGAVDAVEKVA